VTSNTDRKPRSDKGKPRKTQRVSPLRLQAHLIGVDEQTIDAIKYARKCLNHANTTQRGFMVDAILMHKMAHESGYVPPLPPMQLTTEMYNILDKIAYLVNNAGMIAGSDTDKRQAFMNEVDVVRGKLAQYAADPGDLGAFDDET